MSIISDDVTRRAIRTLPWLVVRSDSFLQYSFSLIDYFPPLQASEEEEGSPFSLHFEELQGARPSPFFISLFRQTSVFWRLLFFLDRAFWVVGFPPFLLTLYEISLLFFFQSWGAHLASFSIFRQPVVIFFCVTPLSIPNSSVSSPLPIQYETRRAYFFFWPTKKSNLFLRP